MVLSHSARYVSNTISDAIVVARWVYNVLIEGGLAQACRGCEGCAFHADIQPLWPMMAIGQALPDYHCLLLRHCLVQRCFRIRCCCIPRLASLFYLNPTKTKNAIEFPCAEQFNILRGLLELYMTSFTFSTQVSGFNIMRIQPWHLERPLPVN